jgi:queuosine precursor transporter
VALVAYVGCIVAANWAIKRYGFVPVGFGLVAPAGTYFAGAVFVARDTVQLAYGRWLVLPAIVAGAALSWWTSPSLAVASGVAFLCGELSDWAFFTPLRAAGRFAEAFLAANTVGLLVDTFIFLYLAFGSITHWQGTALGKLWVTLPACAVVWALRRRLTVAAAT